MVLSLPAAWVESYGRSTTTPVVLVRIYADFRRVLRVDDPTAGVGVQVRISQGANFYDLVGDTDFNVSGLNSEQVAQNIAAAWNLAEENRAPDAKTGIRAVSWESD